MLTYTQTHALSLKHTEEASKLSAQKADIQQALAELSAATSPSDRHRHQTGTCTEQSVQDEASLREVWLQAVAAVGEREEIAHTLASAAVDQQKARTAAVSHSWKRGNYAQKTCAGEDTGSRSRLDTDVLKTYTCVDARDSADKSRMTLEAHALSHNSACVSQGHAHAHAPPVQGHEGMYAGPCADSDGTRVLYTCRRDASAAAGTRAGPEWRHGSASLSARAWPEGASTALASWDRDGTQQQQQPVAVRHGHSAHVVAASGSRRAGSAYAALLETRDSARAVAADCHGLAYAAGASSLEDDCATQEDTDKGMFPRAAYLRCLVATYVVYVSPGCMQELYVPWPRGCIRQACLRLDNVSRFQMLAAPLLGADAAVAVVPMSVTSSSFVLPSADLRRFYDARKVELRAGIQHEETVVSESETCGLLEAIP
jgi:hypothetical protein